MLSLIPWWLKLAVLAAIAGGLWGTGYYQGHKSGKAAGEADLAHFRAAVETQAAAAAVHTQQVIAQQEKVSADISTDYEKKLAALRRSFGAGGVRIDQHPDGSQIAQLSCAPASVNGIPADPVPAVSRADFDQLSELSAETTQQLVSLQAWVREQQAAFP